MGTRAAIQNVPETALLREDGNRPSSAYCSQQPPLSQCDKEWPRNGGYRDHHLHGETRLQREAWKTDHKLNRVESEKKILG